VIYQLSKTEKAIQKAASQFAKGEFDCDAARELDKKGVFPKTIWSKAAKLGFIGIHHPEKYSGGGGILKTCSFQKPSRPETQLWVQQ